MSVKRERKQNRCAVLTHRMDLAFEELLVLLAKLGDLGDLGISIYNQYISTFCIEKVGDMNQRRKYSILTTLILLVAAMVVILFFLGHNFIGEKKNELTPSNISAKGNTNYETTVAITSEATTSATLDCAKFYESGIFPPSSTPTWLEYTNENEQTTLTISREITFSDRRSYCLDIPNSDFVINIERDNKHYILSGSEIIRQANENFVDSPTNITQKLTVPTWQDLDGDGEAEIVLNFELSGANCCSVTTVLYFNSQTGEFKTTNGIVRKFSLVAKSKDVDHDGIPEFVTRDSDFSNALGAAVAQNGIAPIQIFRYEGNQIIDVTKEYPTAIEEDSYYWLGFKTSDYDSSSRQLALGAYLADMCLLGKESEAWPAFDLLCAVSSSTEDCEAFAAKAKQVLSQLGYR